MSLPSPRARTLSNIMHIDDTTKRICVSIQISVEFTYSLGETGGYLSVYFDLIVATTL